MKKMLCLLMVLFVMAGCTSNTPTPESTVEPTAVPTVELPTYETVEALLQEGANLVQSTGYTVYHMEDEGFDSVLVCDMIVNQDTQEIVYISIVEPLVLLASGGASGWSEIDEDTVALLGENVVVINEITYPAYVMIGETLWSVKEVDGTVSYTAEIDGEEVDYISYMRASEANNQAYVEAYQSYAAFCDAEGNELVKVEAASKQSIGHGEDFWPSDLHFFGNVNLLIHYVYENGINYTDSSTGAYGKNEDGIWMVNDTVTGATLAGTPNYMDLMLDVYQRIQNGEGTEVK